MSRVLMGLESGAIGSREGGGDGWREEWKRTREKQKELMGEIEFGCRGGISEVGMKDGKRYSRKIGREETGEGSFGIYIKQNEFTCIAKR